MYKSARIFLFQSANYYVPFQYFVFWQFVNPCGEHCFCSTLTWISLLFFVIRETVWVVTDVQLTKLQAIYLQYKLFWALFLPCSSLLIYHVSFHNFFHFIVLWLGKSAVNWIKSNFVLNLFCYSFPDATLIQLVYVLPYRN